MKQPCTRDCPMREAGCGATCKEWQIYEAWRNAEYQKRYEQSVNNSRTAAHDSSIRRQLNQRWKYGRNDKRGKHV